MDPGEPRTTARFRRCVFTLQLRRGTMEATCDEYYSDQMKVAGGDSIKYCVFQREIAPTTGQVHLQGFICFSKKMRRSSFKALHLFGRETCWFEPARGSLKQCEEYCSKTESRAPGCSTMTVSGFIMGECCVRVLTWMHVPIINPRLLVWSAPSAGGTE